MGAPEQIPLPSSATAPRRSKTSTAIKVSLAVLAAPCALYFSFPDASTTVASSLASIGGGCHHRHDHRFALSTAESRQALKGAACPTQVDPLNIGPDWNPKDDQDYVQLAIERLQGAVRIRTESFDDMKHTPEEEPRFAVMGDLHAYLEKTFPRVYEDLDVEKVQTYGLLVTWKGKEETLKPVVLMAHQDTVPVPDFTVDSWTHPPFSAHLDSDGWIWGRGSTDCKNTLVGIFAALDRLIEQGFEPRRTLILSSGFDEEIGGSRSAAYLSRRLEERYGRDGIALILDEGFTGVDESYGVKFARFGTAEKGAVNLKLEVFAPGGHSSVPLGPHTSIGVLARFLVALEDHPAEPNLASGNPMLSYLSCAAEFGHVDKKLRDRVRHPKKWHRLGLDLAESDPVLRSFLATSQAIDLVSGGVKVNALPEYASSTINYRIDFLSSVNETLSRIEHILRPVAKRLDIDFSAFSDDAALSKSSSVMAPQNSTRVKLSVVGDSRIEPAPLTPTEGPAWHLMAGTARHVFDGAIVAPSGMIANTDTKHVWNLTDNIYRFVPAPMNLLKNFHTIDERIHVDAHLTGIQFFYKLLQNTQEWETS